MSRLEPVADDVWLLRGGVPRVMNVYFIVEDGRVTLFDCGIKAMVKQILKAAETFGGVDRVVLSHAHVDHRGAAPYVRAPVYCHPADTADAEGDGVMGYADTSKLEFPPARIVLPLLLRQWDGGPVQIAGTVEEGDDVGGFEVVHLPGHSPGQIALWRVRDRVALTGDVFYTLNIQTSIKSVLGCLTARSTRIRPWRGRAFCGWRLWSRTWPGPATPIPCAPTSGRLWKRRLGNDLIHGGAAKRAKYLPIRYVGGNK